MLGVVPTTIYWYENGGTLTESEYSGLRDTTVRFLGNRRSSKLETSNPAMETKSMTP